MCVCVCVCVCVSAKYQESLFNFIEIDNKHFYDKIIFIGFIKSSPPARLYLEVLVTIARLNVKTVCTDSLLRPVSRMMILKLLLIFSHVQIFQLIRIGISITMRTAR